MPEKEQGRILLSVTGFSPRLWLELLSKSREVVLEPDGPNDPSITYAVVWKQRPNLLAGLPNLRAIFSIGAGVDQAGGHAGERAVEGADLHGQRNHQRTTDRPDQVELLLLQRRTTAVDVGRDAVEVQLEGVGPRILQQPGVAFPPRRARAVEAGDHGDVGCPTRLLLLEGLASKSLVRTRTDCYVGPAARHRRGR